MATVVRALCRRRAAAGPGIPLNSATQHAGTLLLRTDPPLTPAPAAHYRSSTMDDDIAATAPRARRHVNGARRRPAGAQRALDVRVARLAKALGHPARVKIMRVLLRRTECVCGQICRQLPLAQSTVSQHLKILKKAGLIRGEIDPPRICYCANRQRLHELMRLLEAMCRAGRTTAPGR